MIEITLNAINTATVVALASVATALPNVLTKIVCWWKFGSLDGL